MSRVLFLSVLVGAIAPPAYAQAPAGPCKLVFDAMLKETSTPHHAVTTRDGAAMGESISTADATYVKIKGEWRQSPMTPQNMLAQQRQNIGNVTVASCTALPGETIDGQATAVYHTHYEQKDSGASDAKVWIAKATGLPIRSETTLQANQKTSVVTRDHYANIKAPIEK